jgi:hypothetical protein
VRFVLVGVSDDRQFQDVVDRSRLGLAQKVKAKRREVNSKRDGTECRCYKKNLAWHHEY